ncbi:hypothetical protein O6H91_Y222500 [Diphasiastrum complanatum]|nr:hypothetical protein O6H91_Y222500 [Diphasiastrum complanatum]KAJ7294952.1 hypothetical protein O6H91_Y222500 [Diphasiastrum complanatum]
MAVSSSPLAFSSDPRNCHTFSHPARHLHLHLFPHASTVTGFRIYHPSSALIYMKLMPPRSSLSQRLLPSAALDNSQNSSSQLKTDSNLNPDAPSVPVSSNVSNPQEQLHNTDKQRKEVSWSYERLFSNLNEATRKHEPGDINNEILLIAGTTVGAGILAIPAVTQDAGFLPSSLACLLCWFYMVATGLLVAEVNVNTMCELGSGGVSLVSMAFRTLGVRGVQITCGAYLFIHYALLVAYVARSAEIVSNALGTPLWVSATLFTGAFGGLCYFGSQRVIGAVNGALVLAVVATFMILVSVAAGQLQLDALMKANFAAVPQSVPVIALAFVYQNVVPVVCTNLEGNLSKIRSAIVLGTAIPLVMFLVWDAVILGSISSYDASGQIASDPLVQLRSANGIVSPLIEIFSLLAVATSYIGFVLGLSDFLCDLLKLPGGGRRLPLPFLLTLLPPLGLALISPGIFFQALDFAGTYGVLVLFGILPAAMAWAERYTDACPPSTLPAIVPGGRLTLALIVGAASLVISTEIVNDLFN